MKKIPNAKLTPEQVKIITDLFIYTNKSDREIGEFFGVTRECINAIRNGNRWSKVTGITREDKNNISRRVVKKIPTWWREDTEKLVIAKIEELMKRERESEQKKNKRSNDFRDFGK